MTGNVFIDTNIFLYARFDDGKEKFKTANDLFRACFQSKKSRFFLKCEIYVRELRELTRAVIVCAVGEGRPLACCG